MYQIIHKNGGGLAYYGKVHPYHTPTTSLKHTHVYCTVLLLVVGIFSTFLNTYLLRYACRGFDLLAVACLQWPQIC